MSGRRGAVLLIAAGFLFQAGVLCYFLSDYVDRVPRLVFDDLYYYLNIARNVCEGRGSVFSEGVPTNGYHPLWLLITAGLYWILKLLSLADSYTYVGAVLFLCLFLSLLNSCCIYRLSKKLHGSEFAALLSVIFFLFSPWAVLQSLSGLEIGLNILLLTLYSLCFLSLTRDLRAAGYGRFAVLGLVNGLLMLTRTDNVFFCVISLVLLLAKSRLRNYRRVLVSAATSFLVVLPWLLWSYNNFGTIVQSSAVAQSILQHGIAFQDCSSLGQKAITSLQISIGRKIPYFFYQYFISPFTGTYLYAWKYKGISHYVVAIYGILPVCIALSLWWIPSLRMACKRSAGEIARLAVTTDFLTLPALLLWLFYVFIRWYLQVWQFSYLLLIITLFVPLIMLRVRGSGRWRALVVFAAINLVLTFAALRRGYLYPQRYWLKSVIKFDDTAGGRLRIGATDCGHNAFYSRKHEFVNLDGVVNNEVLGYIVRGELSRYLEKEGFDEVWIFDRENRMKYYDRNIGE